MPVFGAGDRPHPTKRGKQAGEVVRGGLNGYSKAGALLTASPKCSTIVGADKHDIVFLT